MFLRNKQKREWEKMKNDQTNGKSSKAKQAFEKQQRAEDMEELEETETSKKLSLAMVRSEQQGNSESDDTLMRAVVDLLHNQNGK